MLITVADAVWLSHASDVGFYLGPRLGKGRGPNGQFSAKFLRKIERPSLSRVK
jgi:hypothetical protein